MEVCLRERDVALLSKTPSNCLGPFVAAFGTSQNEDSGHSPSGLPRVGHFSLEGRRRTLSGLMNRTWEGR